MNSINIVLNTVKYNDTIQIIQILTLNPMLLICLDIRYTRQKVMLSILQQQ